MPNAGSITDFQIVGSKIGRIGSSKTLHATDEGITFGRKDSRAHQGTSTGGQGLTGVAVLCTGIAIGSSATRLERHGTHGGHVTDGRCGVSRRHGHPVAACAKTLAFGAVILAEIVGGGANFPLRKASRRPRKFRARNPEVSGPRRLRQHVAAMDDEHHRRRILEAGTSPLVWRPPPPYWWRSTRAVGSV